MTDVKLEDAVRMAAELDAISDDEMALGWESALTYSAALLRKIPELQKQLAESQEQITRLCDRLDKINLICWSSDINGPNKLHQAKEWSAGFAKP